MIPLVSIVTFPPAWPGPPRARGALPAAAPRLARRGVLTFVLSLPLYFAFDAEIIGYQFEEHRPWMPTLGVSYHVGVDGRQPPAARAADDVSDAAGARRRPGA